MAVPIKPDLVDELGWMTFLIILGTDKRLLAEGLAATAFELTDHLVSSSGVVCTYYQGVGKMKTARVGEYKSLNHGFLWDQF
ncbi:hypothetical protein [Acinetobacter sp. ANC 4779]|uniref:hypothetical protein n=1 Tax=Acinetobacter sp. ANC 4779 TaxID=2529848 RepID=UPI001D18B994|nr:hypothetical protein [Acinetobacter sp. ANC 4779]